MNAETGKPLVRIVIDLNVRVRGNKTYSGFEDIQMQGNLCLSRPERADGLLAIGDKVLAVEPEDGIVTDAEVVDIDHEKRFVYLAVDWHGFRDDPENRSSATAVTGED